MRAFSARVVVAPRISETAHLSLDIKTNLIKQAEIMKKTIKTLLALMTGTLAFSACNKNVTDNNNSDTPESKPIYSLSAVTEGDGTKTVIDGLAVKWETNDAILVVDGSVSSKYNLAEGEGTKTAKFILDEESTAVSGENIYALYPYASGPSFGTESISNVTLPAIQTVAAGQSVDPKAMLMVAEADNSNLAFKNVCSYVKVTSDAPFKKIEVRSNNGESLAGRFTVAVSDAAVSNVSNGSSVVTLKAAEGNLPAGTYYIAVLPGELEYGLNVKFFTGNDTFFYKTVTTFFEFERNKVHDAGSNGSLVGVYWSDRTTYYGFNNYENLTSITIITSPTDEVEKPWWANDLNSDGTLWSVKDENDDCKYYINTTASRIFAKNMDYTFKYMSHLKSIAGLDKIDFSEVTSSYDTFMQCTSLTSLDLSSWLVRPDANLTSMFNGCTALESLALNNTFYPSSGSRDGMFSQVGEHSETGNCVVSGVTDEDVKYAMEHEWSWYMTFAPSTTGIARATIGGKNVKVTWIQLWPDGPKFAEYNVGVTDRKAESYGGYYAWGGCQDKIDDYNTGTDALEDTDDTATNLWGSKWRMMTKSEFEYLLYMCEVEVCEYKWTTVNGVNGYKFTGKEDGYTSNSIFLPAAGYYNVDKVYDLGSSGNYWFSDTNDSDTACYLYFNETEKRILNGDRGFGYSVRAVLK